MVDLLYYDGDLTADVNGDLQLCTDEYHDIIQTANNNILMKYGDNKWHTEFGNKVFGERIKANQGGIEQIIRECTNAILIGDKRVKEISYMNATLKPNATCLIDYHLIVNIGEGMKEIIGSAVVDAFNMSEDE